MGKVYYFLLKLCLSTPSVTLSQPSAVQGGVASSSKSSMRLASHMVRQPI